MEDMEIVMNEETTTDLVPTEDVECTEKSGNGLKVAVGVGLTGLVGVILYKKVIQPMLAKRKAAKDAQKASQLVDQMVDVTPVDVTDETK